MIGLLLWPFRWLRMWLAEAEEEAVGRWSQQMGGHSNEDIERKLEEEETGCR